LYRFGWSFTLSLLSVAAMQFILPKLISNNPTYLNFVESSSLVRFVYSLLMIAFVTVVSWLVFYVENETLNNKRKSEAENILKQAELSLLQLQLQPHFLFNSLNSISALAGSKPVEARKMIQQLSDFYRATLKTEKEQFSTVENELKHLQLYLEIEKVRFGNRLQVTINYDEETLTLKLPVLLLQPIVENAIKFGLYDVIGNVEIQIVASKVNEQLLLTITNPFDSDTSKASEGKGFGLHSIQRRLQLIYGIGNLLKTEKEKNIFKTILEIPQFKIETT
jgi:LytS/YehU family sensor histidine kinase